MSSHEHKVEAEKIVVRFCLLITSDKIIKGLKRDEITPKARELLSKVEGLYLTDSVVVPNDKDRIIGALTKFVDSNKCDVVIVTGGTGISRKDISVDIIRGICEKELPGYGELFRYLTYVNEGTIALASRAMACTIKDKIVFTTPGSPKAFTLAMNKLIIPEVKHLVYMLKYY